MAADAAETLGLEDGRAQRRHARRSCAKFLPAAAAVGNPVDVIGDAEPDRYIKAFEILQEDENIDAIVVVVDAAEHDRSRWSWRRSSPRRTTARSRC